MTTKRTKPAADDSLASDSLERQILGSIMRAARNGNAVAPIVRPLVGNADRFNTEQHRSTYDAIIAISDAGGLPTHDRVKEHLRLTGKIDEASMSQANTWGLALAVDEATIRTGDELSLACEQLVDWSMRRQVDIALREAQSALRTATDSPVKIVAQLTAEAWRVLDGHTRHSKGSAAGELAELYRAHLDTLTQDEDSMVHLRTGLYDVDKALGKRVGLGSFVVIGAHTSVGKTVLATGLIRANGIHGDLVPAHLTMEETRVETQERITAGETRIDLSALQEPATLSADERARLTAFVTLLETERARSYWVEEMAGASLGEILAKIRVLVATIGTRLVIVDYLQIIDVPGKERRERELAECSKRFKGIALELGIIIVALAQLNDEMHGRTADKYPKLSDLRECKALAHDANVVILIDRPEQHVDPDDSDTVPQFHDGVDARGLARLFIPKMRRGKRRRITVRFKGEYQSFEDCIPGDVHLAHAETEAAPSRRKTTPLPYKDDEEPF